MQRLSSAFVPTNVMETSSGAYSLISLNHVDTWLNDSGDDKSTSKITPLIEVSFLLEKVRKSEE